MNSKSLIFIGTIIGSTLGGYIPTLWGADAFSFSSIIFSSLGAILGIYIGFKLSND
ncbi:MAG: hypothetical protein NTW62_03395 [Candidatus Nomurabacteria bacterium]|nr:hypothetical protein [Candidatus Nomurabacteria bacterium]